MKTLSFLLLLAGCAVPNFAAEATDAGPSGGEPGVKCSDDAGSGDQGAMRCEEGASSQAHLGAGQVASSSRYRARINLGSPYPVGVMSSRTRVMQLGPGVRRP